MVQRRSPVLVLQLHRFCLRRFFVSRQDSTPIFRRWPGPRHGGCA
jgi:hypothetical protein